ncbi:MAG: hypothetical protein ACYDBJ_08930 [Aggregatilineales bacterium]
MTMNPNLTFEKLEKGQLKVVLTHVGEAKLVNMMTLHGGPADVRVLEETGHSEDESAPDENKDVWDDFFMFFLLVSPSVEENEFTWGDAGEHALHGSFLLWDGAHDLAHENLEDTPVWYYDDYAVRSIVHELLPSGTRNPQRC